MRRTDRVIAFLRRSYERGKEIQREIDAREQAAKKERGAARRAAWMRRRAAVTRRLGAAATLKGWAHAFYFVCRWLWRAACFLLWLELTGMLQQTGHASDGAIVGWGALTVFVYALGALVGIMFRTVVFPLTYLVVSELVEYRRWKKTHETVV